jgi:L-ascorbate metabolism protein UlaG (beta-lactamase superfamily)
MKVTKYPQSCLAVEENGRRIVIDPGSLVMPRYGAEDLWPLDAILITHQHADHADPTLIKALLSKGRVPVIANESTAKVLGDLVSQIVHDNESFVVADFPITARELPHCLMPSGEKGPQNTGYIIADTLFHAGDGIAIDGLTVQTAALPVVGPDISTKDVFEFIKQLGCQTVVPMHYDTFAVNIDLLCKFAKEIVPDVHMLVLENGATAEV